MSALREWLRLVLASLFYFLGIAFVRAQVLKGKGPLVRILLVHHIKDAGRFERMIRHIARAYNPISFDDFKKGDFSPNKINILLTLDDGYESWYTRGLPILERYKVPALFFVSSGFIETAEGMSQMERYCKENLLLSWTSKPLSYAQLQSSANNPLITIGGHTRHHPFLTQIPEAAAREEIGEDKKKLEELVSKPLNVFAYPFGNHNARIENLVREARYEYGMTTRSDFYTNHYSLYALPRSNHGTVRPLNLRMWVLGAHDLAERVDAFLGRLLK